MSLSEDVIVESLTNRENSGDLTSEETMSVNPQCQHPVFLWGLVDVVSSKVKLIDVILFVEIFENVSSLNDIFFCIIKLSVNKID